MNHSKQDVDATCDTEEKCEKDLIMVGLVGIEDPIRKTVLPFSIFHLFLSSSLLCVFVFLSVGL
jgi:magnesium-transporting ATPase (P-type)